MKFDCDIFFFFQVLDPLLFKMNWVHHKEILQKDDICLKIWKYPQDRWNSLLTSIDLRMPCMLLILVMPMLYHQSTPAERQMRISNICYYNINGY
jgi:hypothetical protein